jgi:hypothetical protein
MNEREESPFAPADTSLEAREVQFEIYRRMGTSGRFRAGLNLCEEVRSGLSAAVRARHPEYDEETVRLATVRLLLGEELFHEVYPDVEVRP